MSAQDICHPAELEFRFPKCDGPPETCYESYITLFKSDHRSGSRHSFFDSIRMENIWSYLAYTACFALWLRFLPYLHLDLKIRLKKKSLTDLPFVSIIIPVRNEAQTIGSLLDSLLQVDYPSVEIIVVDDESVDHTRQIAEQYPVKVLSAPPKPAGWIGKSWACFHGAQQANGSVFLFTDSDTVHLPEGLKRAVNFLKRTGSKFISAPAYHLCRNWWEKILGPFFCILHSGASPYDRINTKNAYALGQYLMIERTAYHAIGGHAAVRSDLADDAALARKTIVSGMQYRMYKGAPVCKIQMYRTFRDFVNGWVRLLRLGMQEFSIGTILLTILPIVALNLNNLHVLNWQEWTPALLTLICFLLVQYKIGRFSALGVILFPVSVLLFIALGLWAAVGHIFRTPLEWKGRRYAAGKVSAG